MNLRWFLPALGLCLWLTASAQAQVGVYLNPIITPVSTSQADTGSFAFLGAGDTSRTFGGVSFGGYWDFNHDPKFGFGIDVRDELEHGNTALLNTFLIGARVSHRSPTSRFKPYLQLSGGFGTTHSPLNPDRIDKALYKVYGGGDYRLGRYVDFRILEVGYGTLTTVSSAQYGGTTPIPAVRLISFSSGLVFHFK